MSERSPIRSTPPPDEPKHPPGRKSSKWCKGKVGREHDWSPPTVRQLAGSITPQIVEDRCKLEQRRAELVAQGRSIWQDILVRTCRVCGKQEYVK